MHLWKNEWKMDNDSWKIVVWIEKKEQETYEREFFIRGVNQNGISFKFGFCRCDSSRSSRGRGSNRLRSALKKENKIEMKSY